MSSFIASRFVSICAALGVLLFASAARAQFAECVQPTAVPDAVFDTIVDQAGFEFGSISAKACKSIVNKGVSACRTQVKLQEKCFRKAYDTNYQISVKECHQLAKQDRKDCKSAAKSIRKEGKADADDSKDFALDVCKDDFKSALDSACQNGISM